MTLTYYKEGKPAFGAGRAAAPSAGGNTLGHRPRSIPHTTYYTPGSMCVPPTMHTALTERDPTAPRLHRPQHQASPTTDGAATTYSSAYHAPEGFDYSADLRVRRPTAIAAPSATPPSPHLAQHGRSTYQMEILERSSRDINGSPGSRFRGASGGGSASAPGSPAHRHGIAAVRPGYLTTPSAASALVAERFATSSATATAATASAEAAKRPGSPGWSPLATGSLSPAASMGSCSGASACFRDQAALARAQSAAAAAAGAGARGIAAAGAGARGAGAAGSSLARPSKDAAYLCGLDQHSRGRLPGYTGHRAQHHATLELPAPSKLTTWGADSQAALRRPLPPNEASHGIKSSLLGFFSAGTAATEGGFVSENGLAEASRFHETTRPLEGLMRIPQASHTTRHGAKFTG